MKEITFAGSVEMYFRSGREIALDPLGITQMEIAELSRFKTVKSEVRGHDVTILLGYSIFAIVLLIAIYFDSMSSGIAPGDLASITVFP